MIRQIVRRASLGLAIVWASVAAPILAVAIELPSTEPSEVSPYVPGELLVIFTAETADAIEQAQAAGQLPVTGLGSLDDLVAKYGVARIEPVFASLQDAEAIRMKFPERSRRAPPGAELPDLSRTYKLTLDPAHDLADVLIAFLSDPHVESAEPNYIATIQAPVEPLP